ncbi:hypothetical protein [Anaeroselena agilis]|uniref:Rad50/SbcC-type AAA domain-containing protein n=1 Tax=Anaeroselena agilis TaxID=3063788 RepID=A0ABU3P0W1_9FIRM|nr:hypothetical protein [Selenomonadales bacterium 4137-cl]
MSMIKRLVIRNALGIKELVVNAGHVNLIRGGNERGKTSILECIEKALYNQQRRAKFVRTGEDQAYLELETDDGLKVERSIPAEGDPSAKVTIKGHPITTPESYLKELFGVVGKRKGDVFAFNPVDFMAKKDTEQTGILLGMLPISVTAEDAAEWFGPDQIPAVDYSKHGLQVVREMEKWWYDGRHQANSDVRSAEAELDAVRKNLPDNYRLEDWENVQLSAMYDQIRAIENVNSTREKAQLVIDRYDQDVANIKNKYQLQANEAQDFRNFKAQQALGEVNKAKLEIEAQLTDINNQIAELEKQRAVLVERWNNLNDTGLQAKTEALDLQLQEALKGIEANKQRELDQQAETKKNAETYLANNPAVDPEPLQFKAKHAEEMKGFIPLAKQVAEIANRLKGYEERATLLDRFVQICRAKPAELLATVELPLEGLGVDENGMVTIKGLPLSNLSTSKQVRVCLDIARAYAKDNPLKLICVDKLEHLDATVKAEFLKQILVDKAFQYFVTEVTDGDLVIETEAVANAH